MFKRPRPPLPKHSFTPNSNLPFINEHDEERHDNDDKQKPALDFLQQIQQEWETRPSSVEEDASNDGTTFPPPWDVEEDNKPFIPDAPDFLTSLFPSLPPSTPRKIHRISPLDQSTEESSFDSGAEESKAFPSPRKKVESRTQRKNRRRLERLERARRTVAPSATPELRTKRLEWVTDSAKEEEDGDGDGDKAEESTASDRTVMKDIQGTVEKEKEKEEKGKGKRKADFITTREPRYITSESEMERPSSTNQDDITSDHHHHSTSLQTTTTSQSSSSEDNSSDMDGSSHPWRRSKRVKFETLKKDKRRKLVPPPNPAPPLKPGHARTFVTAGPAPSRKVERRRAKQVEISSSSEFRVCERCGDLDDPRSARIEIASGYRPIGIKARIFGHGMDVPGSRPKVVVQPPSSPEHPCDDELPFYDEMETSSSADEKEKKEEKEMPLWDIEAHWTTLVATEDQSLDRWHLVLLPSQNEWGSYDRVLLEGSYSLTDLLKARSLLSSHHITPPPYSKFIFKGKDRSWDIGNKVHEALIHVPFENGQDNMWDVSSRMRNLLRAVVRKNDVENVPVHSLSEEWYGPSLTWWVEKVGREDGVRMDDLREVLRAIWMPKWSTVNEDCRKEQPNVWMGYDDLRQLFADAGLEERELREMEGDGDEEEKEGRLLESLLKRIWEKRNWCWLRHIVLLAKIHNAFVAMATPAIFAAIQSRLDVLIGLAEKEWKVIKKELEKADLDGDTRLWINKNEDLRVVDRDLNPEVSNYKQSDRPIPSLRQLSKFLYRLMPEEEEEDEKEDIVSD